VAHPERAGERPLPRGMGDSECHGEGVEPQAREKTVDAVHRRPVGPLGNRDHGGQLRGLGNAGSTLYRACHRQSNIAYWLIGSNDTVKSDLRWHGWNHRADRLGFRKDLRLHGWWSGRQRNLESSNTYSGIGETHEYHFEFYSNSIYRRGNLPGRVVLGYSSTSERDLYQHTAL